MFKKVLVGVDGTPRGRDAVALARGLSDPHAKLTLAFVRSGELAEDVADSDKLLREERAAANIEAELAGVVATSPGRGLHEQAEKLGADLLVVGSCSHGALGRAMLGDDTRAALDGAPCALAIAARGFAERPVIARVGIGYDGSPESTAALAVAHDLAAKAATTLFALQVVSLPPLAYGGLVAPGIGEYIEELLQEASSRMERLPDVDARAVYGFAGEELAAFGDELDLLVVGSRGYGPLRRLVNGSTANYLERHARCSLFVLPRTAAGHAADFATSVERAGSGA